MTKVIGISRQKGYLNSMLLINKGKTSLQVWHVGPEVYVVPLMGEFDNRNMLSTIARNEQLLAQLFLNHADAADPLMQLSAYFMQRGWLVKEMEGLGE